MMKLCSIFALFSLLFVSIVTNDKLKPCCMKHYDLWSWAMLT